MSDDRRILYVNSGDQLSQTSNIFTANLQHVDDIGVNRIAVLQAAIPISYYTIQNGLNTFTLEENSTRVAITLKPGNYTQASFATYLTTQLNTTSPNGLTYTISYAKGNTPQDGLYTYTVNSSTITVKFIFSSSNTVNEQAGFNSGSTNTFTPGSGTSTLIGNNVSLFVPETTVYLHSNLVDSGSDDVLQEFYNQNQPPFSYIVFLNPDPKTYSKKLHSTKLQAATFSITDENGIPIYLNGINLAITLCFFTDRGIDKALSAYLRYMLLKEHELSSSETVEEKTAIQPVLPNEGYPL